MLRFSLRSRFAHAHYGSQMIDRFLYWGDHRNQKSGEIKGSCQPPLDDSDDSAAFVQALDSPAGKSLRLVSRVSLAASPLASPAQNTRA